MIRRPLVAAAVAMLVTAGCGPDLPGDSGRSPVASAERARLVDVDFVPFARTDLWFVTLAERAGDRHLYAAAQQGVVVRVDRPTLDDVRGGELPLVDLDDVVLDLTDQNYQLSPLHHTVTPNLRIVAIITND